MFTSKQAMTAREVGSAHAQLTALLETRDSWYDGTVASVDRRLAALENARPIVRRVASVDPAMLAQAEKIDRERADLLDLKNHLLSAGALQQRRTLPRISSVGPLSHESRRFIAMELPHFLADNVDAHDDLDEMDERAENHAQMKTLQLPVTPTAGKAMVAHFRLAVNWHLRNRKPEQPRVARVVEAGVDDLPDDILFG